MRDTTKCSGDMSKENALLVVLERKPSSEYARKLLLFSSAYPGPLDEKVHVLLFDRDPRSDGSDVSRKG